MERQRNKSWGIFNHYLYDRPGSDLALGKDEKDWNAMVQNLDVHKIASQIAQTNAGYYCITVMQGRKYMLAPNAVFDEIAGTKPGEACAERDLTSDLYEALAVHGIELYLYFTGDGPWKDDEIGRKFGFFHPRTMVTKEFCVKWSSVLKEYALRYGDKVKGWWMDGFYDLFGYCDALMELYYDAAKAGNPNAVMAFNNGVKKDLYKRFYKEEYTSGEFNDFTVIPKAPLIDGARAHILAPLGVSADGNPWGQKGTNRDKEYMRNYVETVNRAGGRVTIDVYISDEGDFDPQQLEVLRYLQ